MKKEKGKEITILNPNEAVPAIFLENGHFMEKSDEWDAREIKKQRILSMALDEAIEQGGILEEVSKEHGMDGFEAFFRSKGLSRAQAFNYKRLYKNRDEVRKLGLPVTSSTRLPPLLEDDEVTIEKNKIIFPDGSELPIDVSGLSARKVEALVETVRKAKKELRSKEKQLAEIGGHHEKEIETIRDENRKLRNRVQASKVTLFMDCLEAFKLHFKHMNTLVGMMLETNIDLERFKFLTDDFEGLDREYYGMKQRMADRKIELMQEAGIIP